ncbi:TPA: pentapeptide repeat-containing protein, partial [Streptococcus suis]|nr:pentapeptide repeat-containing protein [Streptococcus suis]
GMLQAPTVLANTGATASEPTIENQADTGGGAAGGSEAAQPTTTTTPAPAAATPAPTPAPAESTTPGAENTETRTAEEPAAEISTTSTQESTFGNQIISEVSTDEFTLVGQESNFESAYNRGLQNIINGNPGDISTAGDDYVVADLKWTGKSLPETVGFVFDNAGPLEHMVIYKRTNNNGTLKKYKLEVFSEGQEDPIYVETKTIENPHESDIEQVQLASHGSIKKVNVTFIEAVNRTGNINNSALTIKEITFFKKSEIRGRQIEKERLQVIADDSKFETQGGGRLPAKLNDGKFSTLGELRWNAQYTLASAPITLQLRDGQPAKVTGVAVYKRPKNNGSLTKYKIETYNQEQLVQTISDISVGYDASLSEVRLDGSPITKIVFTALEAKDRHNQPTTTQLTLREIQLFEADPQEVEQPDINEPSSENTGSENTGSENTGSENTGSENTGSENTGSENTGSENTGSENTGSENTGSENTGSENTGSENTGSENTGSENTGSENTG